MNVLANHPERVTFGEDDRKFVYAVARRLVRSDDDAEDVTQEALLLAYRHRDAFRGESRYRTWLYRIAATTALGHLRRSRSARVVLLANARDQQQLIERQADVGKTPGALLEDAEQRGILEQAIAGLAAPYREVLLARVDATEHEVAERLGLSVANVKVRAHRARKQLRATLETLDMAA